MSWGGINCGIISCFKCMILCPKMNVWDFGLGKGCDSCPLGRCKIKTAETSLKLGSLMELRPGSQRQQELLRWLWIVCSVEVRELTEGYPVGGNQRKDMWGRDRPPITCGWQRSFSHFATPLSASHSSTESWTMIDFLVGSLQWWWIRGSFDQVPIQKLWEAFLPQLILCSGSYLATLCTLWWGYEPLAKWVLSCSCWPMYPTVRMAAAFSSRLLLRESLGPAVFLLL